jgi:hypothetical protein
VDPVFASPDAWERALWLGRARAAGARIVRINLSWAAAAPSAPATPADPADPAYRWTAVDDAVRDSAERGLRVLLTLGSAPRWAEGPRRPRAARPGSWRPDPEAYGHFAEAAARRYSGAYPDPGRPGGTLPAVRAWQAWNEPNLASYLAPQWRRVGGRFVDAAAGRYRSLLRALYRGVKSVSRRNLVVTAGTAPYGDPRPGGSRIMPVRFWRDLLCLREADLRATACGPPARFDVLAHHPYAVGGPRRRALNADDVAVPDMRKLARLLGPAVRQGRALPRRRKRLWVTELSWDSRPPDRFGVPTRRHARWLAEAFDALRRQDVDTVLWFQVRDQAPVPSFAATNQSGLYLRSGAPKPARRAFARESEPRGAPGAAGAILQWGGTSYETFTKPPVIRRSHAHADVDLPG